MMDINEDRACGKNTIAVVIGQKPTLMLILFLTLLESWSGFVLLSSQLLGYFSAFGACLLLSLHLASHFGLQVDYKFVSVSQSIVGVVLMLYLWNQGVLLA